MHYLARHKAITPELLALALGSEQLQSAWVVPDKARSGPTSGPTQLPNTTQYRMRCHRGDRGEANQSPQPDLPMTTPNYEYTALHQ